MSRESAKPMMKLPFTLLGLVLWLPRVGLPEDDTAKAAAKKPEESEAKEKGAKEKKEDAAGPEVALRSGDYDDAVSGFRKALEADAANVRAARGLADALAATGKYGDALEALRATRDFEKSPALLAAAGKIQLRKGQLEEAEKSFRAALSIDKSHVESLNRLGETLSKRGHPDEAKSSWNALVDLYQEMDTEAAEKAPADDFVEMGLALVGLNRFKEANEVMFSTASDKDPKCPALLLEWGRTFMAKYDYPASREHLKKAIDQNRHFADALVVLADNYLEDFQVGTERYNQAEKRLKEALEVNPNHAGAHLVRGLFELSDGRVGAAMEALRKSIELDPSSLRARGCLAACLYLEADEEGLKASERDALAVNPRGAEFYHSIALAIEDKFRYQDAVRYSEKALEADPDYWPAYVTLGTNCLRTGDDERGRKFLAKSWENDKYNVWVFNTRKLLTFMDDNFKELRTEHFVFKLPKKEFEELSLYLAPLLEDAYVKLGEHYKVELPNPVYIEAFSDHKWFSARTVGLGGFAASGACFGNVVTLTTPKALPQNWGAVAWHEFAHVATLKLTKHRVPRWLTEGLSVFEEGRDHPRWARVFEREIADVYASGLLLPIEQLDFGFSKPKYPNQILISYFQGCLVAKYIEGKWSWDAILSILKGYGDNKSTAQIFKEVLGQSLEEFDKGFFAYVEKWIAANGYEPKIAEEGVTGLELASQASPKDVKKLIDLAWAYLSSGNEVDAPITAQKALELDPENADAHAILGLDYFRQKNWPKAKENLEPALAGKTRFQFRTLSALGEIALKDGGDKTKAVELFEKAKEASPRGGASYPEGKNLYYKLHDLYMEQGKEDLAIARMEELSRTAPEDGKCLQRVAAYYMKKGDEASLRHAKDAYEALLFINPFDKGTHEFLARTAAKLGENDLVIREYNYLLKFPETNPKVAYLALAKAHAGKKDAPAAVKFARKVLELDSENSEAKGILEQFPEK